MSRAERRALVEREAPALPVSRQCRLLAISRSSVYRRPAEVSEEDCAITISMDGKGRYMDNIFVERLWRSLKYEEVYLNAYESVAEAKAGIGAWLSFYNDERQHQSLGYRTPRQIYQEGLWICGRSASPTGCASPASRASSEGGKMLAFAHIPTGATANEGFNIDEVNNRFAEPAVALTATGADIETGRVTP